MNNNEKLPENKCPFYKQCKQFREVVKYCMGHDARKYTINENLKNASGYRLCSQYRKKLKKMAKYGKIK